MTSNTYHHEIDGLRAVSVLVIILFHLGVTTFEGGFIGVDVFFVISGYLITRIIVTGLHSGAFSFSDFYIRRGARILPALVATVALVLPLAMYLQQPAALVQTAQQSIYALLSLSNMFFWAETSYWAPAAEKFVLLHTWSLGVEEQFYLVYPLLLALAYRVGGARGVIAVLAGIAVLGTAASEAVLEIDHSAAFYFAPLRFYEFAFGGLAATLPCLSVLQRSAPVASSATAIGLALILFGCLQFNDLMPLPGILMLIPITGAILVLLAGPSAIARILLMNPLMSWLGKTSYALYLVHWPIIVFYRAYFGASLSVTEQCVLFVAIALAAGLLSRAVERRYRLRQGSTQAANGLSSRTVLIGTSGMAALIAVTCILLIASNGWPARMPEETQALVDLNPRKDMRSRKKYLQEHCIPAGETFCGERQPGETNILLLGDSRVLDIYIALKTAYPDANIQASYAMGCIPVFSKTAGVSLFYPDCPQLNQTRLQAALDAPPEDIIFLAQDLSDWRSNAIIETVVRLRESGKTVFVTGEFQIANQNTPIDIEIESLRFPERAEHLQRYLVDTPFSLDGEFAEEISTTGAVYLSYKPLFFDGEYHFTDRASGKLLTYDGKHLNHFGAVQFGNYLREHYPLPE